MLFALGFWEVCKVVGCYATFDLKNIPQLRKINCRLQNARAEKFARWAAGCYAGLVAKATPLPPQNQLHLAECTCRKSCMVGCDVLRGIPFRYTPPTPLLRSAKSIAPSQNVVVEKAAWWAAR